MPIPKDKDGLTEKQRLYAREYVRNGGKGEAAAIEAGYGVAGARQRSTENLRIPAVQEEIRRASNEMMSEYAPMCIKVLAELAEKAESETVRNSAASTLLDRTGYKLPERLEVTDNRTAADVEADLARILGISVDDGKGVEASGKDEALH